MSPHFHEMVEVARAYCDLIERAENVDALWLGELAVLLPRLHVAVSALGAPNRGLAHSLMPDLDARFEIFAQLRSLLGSKDGYWMEFDVAQDGQFMTGSLADDLTDIYCELKHGLGVVDEEPGRAFDGWRSGYRVHWGQHLVDAERHLYELRSRNQF